MPIQKLHPVYQSLKQVVRAFTDDSEQSHLRVSLIAKQLYEDGILSNAGRRMGLVIENPDNDEDNWSCENCSKSIPHEDMVSHGDILVCPACHAAWEAERDTCTHDWLKGEDSWGDPGYTCQRCNYFLPADEPTLPTVGACAPSVQSVTSEPTTD